MIAEVLERLDLKEESYWSDYVHFCPFLTEFDGSFPYSLGGRKCEKVLR